MTATVPVRHDAVMIPLRVLVVDDEPAFRRSLAALLAADGRCAVVAQAGSGVEALQMLASGADAIDVAVVDVRMPGMTGLELAARVCEAHHHLAVVVCSTAVADVDPGLLPDHARFVGKDVIGPDHVVTSWEALHP